MQLGRLKATLELPPSASAERLIEYFRKLTSMGKNGRWIRL